MRNDETPEGDTPRQRTISIHSLRVEGDSLVYSYKFPEKYFNPLPPCGGRLSTFCVWYSMFYFNPLPPCGGRLGISPYAVNCVLFQSTPSVWRETFPTCRPKCQFPISIHFLRVEGDRITTKCICVRGTISIHSLRVEGDTHTEFAKIDRSSFQSTPSVWRETVNLIRITRETMISIHSLRVEGDESTRRKNTRGVQISIHSLRVEGDGRYSAVTR